MTCFFQCLVILFAIVCGPSFSFAQMASEEGSVELSADSIEYSVDGNTVIAKGRVVIIRGETKLYADEVEFYRNEQKAKAQGNVKLIMEKSEIRGAKMEFDFNSMMGDFYGAKIYAAPYYGGGRKISKVGDNKMLIYDGYMTTTDFDKPEYRLRSNRIEVYPGDKMVARNVRMVMGRVPVMYIPKFTQSLKDTKPRVMITPGYDKEWGAFLLLGWRYYFNENFKGVIHTDYRERLDFGSGIDLNYNLEKQGFGSGFIKTYYTNERKIASDHFFEEKPSPTVERERFKAEWRHKWDIDETTLATLQYYKISDAEFLKDFFRREYDKDSSPDTFFLLTKNIPSGTLSFRVEPRVNRFESKVERLPELRYDMVSKEIAESGVFFKNQSILSNFSSKAASPSEVRQETFRFHADNELAYPTKVGIFEFRPYVGGKNTYYSKTKDPEKYDSIRGIFKTGASISTKFFKVYDTKTNVLGMDINRLRHIITPTVTYDYTTDPTISASQLDVFDEIDPLQQVHKINFAIENKLQTKRNNNSVDLLRFIVNTDFHLKEEETASGFDYINTDIDFRPIDWLTLYADSRYDLRKDRLDTANFDVYVNGKENKWSFGIGKRFNREVDDLVTAQFNYKVNAKWALRMYERIDVKNGQQKEFEIGITRDLHAWLMDIVYNETRGEGSEIFLLFTLKAFPDLAVDVGTGFNERKAGSQSSGGE